jgi:hypothetical protein
LNIQEAQLQKELIPTRVSVANHSWRVGELVFPKADEVRLDFQTMPLRVLQGQTTITGLVSRSGTSSAPLRILLTLQACDNSHCLAPQTRTLVLRME